MSIVQAIKIGDDVTDLEMFLGPLESAIMRALWDNNHTSPKIWRYVSENYTTTMTDMIAYTTVTSTVNRLVTRGLITRTGDKRSYVYSARYTEDDFIEACIRATIWALLRAYPEAVRDVLRSLAHGETVTN